jgi:hypothetical protein
MESSSLAEWLRQTFHIDEMSPEEFAGRHSHEVMCMGFELSHHKDPEIDAWFTRLKEIVSDYARITELRKQYLNPKQLRFLKIELANNDAL